MDSNTERIAAAVAQLVSAIQELRDLKVIRSRRVAPDFAEWLVAQLYDGTLAENRNQAGWDVKCEDEHLQVKMAFEDATNRCAMLA